MPNDAIDLASLVAYTPIVYIRVPPVLDMSMTITETNAIPIILTTDPPVLDLSITYERDVYRL